MALPREKAPPNSFVSFIFESSSLDRSTSNTAQPVDLEVIVAEALQTSASGAAIVLEQHGTFVCAASVGPSAPPVGTIVETDSGLSALCLKTGSVFRCDDADTDLRVNQEACRALEIRSVVTVPVICNGRISGLLEVFSGEPHAFDDRAVAFLLELAESVAPAARVPEKFPKVERPEQIPTEEIPEQDVPASVEPPKFQISENSPNRRNAYLLTTLLLAAVLIPVGISLQRKVNRSALPAEVQETRSTAVPDSVGQGASANILNFANESAVGARRLDADSAYAFAKGLELKQDFVEAYAWYVIAASEGNKSSEEAIKTLTPRMPETSIAQVRFRLGQIFERGDRVPADLETAYFWYSLSGYAGDLRASAQKERIGRSLGNYKRQQADARAARWLMQHSTPKSQLIP